MTTPQTFDEEIAILDQANDRLDAWMEKEAEAPGWAFLTKDEMPWSAIEQMNGAMDSVLDKIEAEASGDH